MQEPEIRLNGWVTVKTLAEKLNKSTSYVSANVARKRIPFREIIELNNIRLVLGDWKPTDKPRVSDSSGTK